MSNKKNITSYSLKTVRAFAQDDEQSLRLILQSFVSSSQENLQRLKHDLKEGDSDELAELAHKMLAMFRQLEADEIVQLLKQLEEKNTPFEQREARAQQVIPLIEQLLQEIKTSYQLH
ncbi:Hpt domain-containing protein [Sunxiuqinia elliptica]|uniref:Hpt domain-containing protein n=1 Tax=Sunxiuqinia elliptica TaxID=655355 RepID=A0A1I2IKX1_9BACT|nr:Hpt domain-containing protein [Sunxiuqinia elliptica]SFF42283.1 Hpt domain-containing protein [Sunxiuqinia elliptica]